MSNIEKGELIMFGGIVGLVIALSIDLHSPYQSAQRWVAYGLPGLFLPVGFIWRHW